MATISIELDEGVLLATGKSREEFVKEAKLLLLLKLFERGEISSGKAAQLLQMNRVDFLLTAGRMGIPVVDLDEAELASEFQDA